jgi:hypothetical protein
MPRSYGDKFLVALKDGDPNRLGVKLGRVCVEANLLSSELRSMRGSEDRV